MTRAEPIVDALLEATGTSIRAVILFGSQLVRTTPGEHSAWDLVLVVDDYRAFHEALVASGHHRRPAWLLSLLARVLPPNITAFDPGEGRPMAKCAIVSSEDLERALGPRARDHFLKGRMVQKVAVVHARDDEERRRLEHLLARARRDVLRWVGPYLSGPVTAEGLARRMLEVSYGGEIRPESEGRAEQVFLAQQEFLRDAYTDVLAHARKEGAVERLEDGRYRLTPGTAAGRLRMALYFTRSKIRATMRWLKHIVTFNDWLTYIQRKVERRTGMRVEITPWERRLPLLLLWPKVVRVLRARGGGDEALTSGEDS